MVERIAQAIHRARMARRQAPNVPDSPAERQVQQLATIAQTVHTLRALDQGMGNIQSRLDLLYLGTSMIFSRPPRWGERGLQGNITRVAYLTTPQLRKEEAQLFGVAAEYVIKNAFMTSLAQAYPQEMGGSLAQWTRQAPGLEKDRDKTATRQIAKRNGRADNQIAPTVSAVREAGEAFGHLLLQALEAQRELRREGTPAFLGEQMARFAGDIQKVRDQEASIVVIRRHRPRRFSN